MPSFRKSSAALCKFRGKLASLPSSPLGITPIVEYFGEISSLRMSPCCIAWAMVAEYRRSFGLGKTGKSNDRNDGGRLFCGGKYNRQNNSWKVRSGSKAVGRREGQTVNAESSYDGKTVRIFIEACSTGVGVEGKAVPVPTWYVRSTLAPTDRPYNNKITHFGVFRNNLKLFWIYCQEVSYFYLWADWENQNIYLFPKLTGFIFLLKGWFIYLFPTLLADWVHTFIYCRKVSIIKILRKYFEFPTTVRTSKRPMDDNKLHLSRSRREEGHIHPLHHRR